MISKSLGRFGLLWVLAFAFLLTYWAPLEAEARKKKPKEEKEEYRGKKKLIALRDFENRSDWHAPGVGRGVTDILINLLVETKRFRVVEREALNRVFEEQKLGQSGAVTKQTAPRLGKLLGAAALITGSITQIGRQEHTGGLGVIGKFNLGTKKTTGYCTCDIRMIDTTTGEVLWGGSAEGEDSTGGLALSTKDFNIGGGARFHQSLEGKAARKAMTAAVEKIAEVMEKIPWSGKVIKVTADGVVYINDGSVKVGEKLQVYRAGEELIDPDTGISLGSEDELLGTMTITEVRQKFSKAKPDCPAGQIKRGDIVREIPSASRHK